MTSNAQRKALAENRHLGPMAKATHRMTGSSTYRRWSAMIQRCTNPKNSQYKNYGARGICVCNRWLKFETFLADMGVAPAGMSLERRENNRGYFPANCFWATPEDQHNNKRTNVVISFGGEKKTLKQWSRHTGIGYSALRARLERGWNIEKALTVPARSRA